MNLSKHEKPYHRRRQDGAGLGRKHVEPLLCSGYFKKHIDNVKVVRLLNADDPDTFTEFESLATEETLRPRQTQLNLLDGGQPTHAAILLFGKQPQRFLLTSEVKCLHFHGAEVRKPIPSYQVYKGTVFHLVDQAVDFVMSKIARAVGTRALGPRALVDYELPRQAVAEAIVNAIAHRDYASNASVQVMLFSGRLEVWNPGRLPPPLTPESLRAPHASIPRNPLIAEPLFLARYIEKAGTGTLDMIALCKAAGLPAPQFRQDGGQFIQTLHRPKPAAPPKGEPATQSPTQSPTQSSDPVTRLLAILSRGEKSSSDLRKALGIKHRPTFRENYLHPALKEACIEMTLPNRPNSRLQKYRLTEKGRARFPSTNSGTSPTNLP